MSDWRKGLDTAPKDQEICTATQFGAGRWSFNHAWFDPMTEAWTDEFGDFLLPDATHWVPLPESSE